MKKVHVGFLLSYDYEKLKSSIPMVYKSADRIFIAMDKEQRTWKGNFFDIDASFFDWLNDFDVDNKIEVYKDNFYISNLSAIDNDTRERYYLSQKMGLGNWLVQVDADEIFIDFEKFVKTLRKYDSYLDDSSKAPIQISGFLINIYKYVDGGVLYVNQPTKVMLATSYPNYKCARNTKERVIYTNNVLLHDCLPRTEEALTFKIENWGHNHAINPDFLNKWKKANATNYKTVKDVFYLEPSIWKELDYFPMYDMAKIKDVIEASPHLNPTKLFLFKKNFGQWFKNLKPFKKDRTAFESYF